jgi:hypothetical protein
MAVGAVVVALLGSAHWADAELPLLATPLDPMIEHATTAPDLGAPRAVPGRTGDPLGSPETPSPATRATPVPVVVPPTPAAAPPVANPIAPAATAGAAPPPAPTAEPDLRPPDPTLTVARFYQLLQAGDFDGMTLLLSARLRDALGWNPDLMRQRTPPGRLTINRAVVVGHDVAYRQATVAVDVVEQTTAPLVSTVRYTGTWQLVRGPSGWLLDASNIQAERA